MIKAINPWEKIVARFPFMVNLQQGLLVTTNL